jgi:dihydroorotase
VNKTRITLEKQSWQVPELMRHAGGELVPYAAGEQLAWKLAQS